MSQANKPTPTAHAREPRQEAQITELSAESTREPSSRHHRCSPRAAVELDVSLGSDHNFYAGFVENLSAGGVFVATHLLRPVGEVIELSIYISDDDDVVKGTGEVRWLREYNEESDVPPGMGVKFLTLVEGADKSIEKFLAQRDPMFFDDEDEAAVEPAIVPAAASAPPVAAVSAPPVAIASAPPVGAASAPPVGAASTPLIGAASTPPIGAASTPPVAAASAPPAAIASAPPVGAASTPPVGAASTPPVGAASTPPVGAASTPPVAAASAPPVGAASTPPAAALSGPPVTAADPTASPEAAAASAPASS